MLVRRVVLVANLSSSRGRVLQSLQGPHLQSPHRAVRQWRKRTDLVTIVPLDPLNLSTD